MNRSDYDIRAKPYLIDRLIDLEPGIHQEPLSYRQANLRQLKESVMRDVEWLLNTRQMIGGVFHELTEAAHSLASYGLPDFTNINFKNESDRATLRRAIETAISDFEPRLEDVNIEIVEERGTELSLNFRIIARLKVEPAPEPVTFDTTLKLDSGQYLVREA